MRIKNTIAVIMLLAEFKDNALSLSTAWFPDDIVPHFFPTKKPAGTQRLGILLLL
jgi:hypothetical protein